MNENDLKGQRAALYIRVSTDEQARHGLSLDEQRHELKAFANKNGFDIVGFYEDEGASARKSLQRRKGLQLLLQDIKADLVDVVLFIKLDRWFRNVKDFYKVQDILDAHNVKWIATREQYNTTSTNGRFMLNMRLSVAQNESDQTADRIKFVFEGKKRRHEAICGNLPRGYKVDKDKNSKTYKQIIIDDESAAAIADIFQHFLVSQSIIDTTNYAREKHGIDMRHVSIRRLLKNESYIGTFYHIPNYAPAIVDVGTFRRVGSVLYARRIDTPRKPAIPFLFSGLVHCPECNHILVGNKGHKYPKQTEYKNKFYRCPLHNIEKSCGFSGTIFERPLEKYLLSHLREKLEHYTASFQRKKKSETNSKVKSLREALDRLKDLYINGFIDRGTYENDYRRYRKELEKALSDSPIPHAQPPTAIIQAAKLISSDSWLSVYQRLTLEKRRTFWHSILKEIDVTRYEKGKGARKEFRLVFL